MQQLPLDNTKRQKVAMYMHERRKHGGQIWRADPELYERNSSTQKGSSRYTPSTGAP